MDEIYYCVEDSNGAGKERCMEWIDDMESSSTSQLITHKHALLLVQSEY